jgi:uncharacterized protein (TIRG00374 family)
LPGVSTSLVPHVSQRVTRIVNVVFLVLGIALLVAVLLRLDAGHVWRHVRAAGWFLVPAFFAYASSLAMSAASWGRAFPPAHRVRFRVLYAVFWAGHAINQVAPGGATGTVVKGTMLARAVDGEEVTASLVTYSYLDAVSVILMTLIGPVLCLVWFDVPRDVVALLALASGVLALGVFGLRVMLRRGLVGHAVRLFRRLPVVRARNLERLQERALRVDERVRAFRQARPGDLRATVAWMAGARAAQVAEAWLLLGALMPEHPSGELFLLALLTQSASQLIQWVAAFVPGRIGVSEGGIALLFELLGFGSVVGLAFGLLRLARKVVGVSMGLVIGAVLHARPPRRIPPELEDAAHPVPLGPTDSEA